VDHDLLLELIRASPGILTVALAAVIVARLLGPFREHVLPNLSSVKAFGVELDLRLDDVRKAGASKGVPVTIAEDSAVYERAVRSQPVLRDAEVLWVDDHPAVDVLERRLLHRIGVFVEAVRSTDEALRALATGPGAGSFELVVSDMRRGGDARAGESLIAGMRSARFDQPVILYVDKLDEGRPTPVGAFGITDRPDELLHLVIDALERRPTAPGSSRSREGSARASDRTGVRLELPGEV
jgi:CheY-like chemotaxis protein